MKVLKRAEQKNVIIDRHFHTVSEISEMLAEKVAFYFDDECEISQNAFQPFEVYDETIYRLFLDCVTEIKVICENGYYCTVAVLKNGKKIHIEL